MSPRQFPGGTRVIQRSILGTTKQFEDGFQMHDRKQKLLDEETRKSLMGPIRRLKKKAQNRTRSTKHSGTASIQNQSQISIGESLQQESIQFDEIVKKITSSRRNHKNSRSPRDFQSSSIFKVNNNISDTPMSSIIMAGKGAFP